MVRKEIFTEEDAWFFGRVKYLQTTSGEGHLSFGITTEITKLLASPKNQSYDLNFLTTHMTIPLASAMLVMWHSFPLQKQSWCFKVWMPLFLTATVEFSRNISTSSQNIINNQLPCILSNLQICHAQKCYLKHSWSFWLQNFWAIEIAFLKLGKVALRMVMWAINKCKCQQSIFSQS